MELHELSPVLGSTKVGKRKGRGCGTGNGKTAGRGHKGQKARSGGKVRIGFEGGQMPLARRIPKRGFNNIYAKPLTAINIASLNRFDDGAVVDAEALIEKGIIHDCRYGLKVLSNGKLEKKLNVELPVVSVNVIKKKDGTKEEKTVSPFSRSAKAAIEAAGGKAEVI